MAEEQFQIISKNWNPILELNDPIEIDGEIMRQKERCNDLIEQKNVLISNLKDEMKLVDETFYRDLQKQVRAYPNFVSEFCPLLSMFGLSAGTLSIYLWFHS